MMEKFLKIIKNGVLIGLILFATVYFGIYFIAGNDVYKQEILNLTNINMFAKQILMSSTIGILCVVLFEFIKYAGKRMRENEKKRDIKKSTKAVLLYCSFIIIITVLIGVVIEKGSIIICNEIIGMMYVINTVTGMCVCALIFGLKSAIEELLINKKINQFNNETKQAMEDTKNGKNLSKVFNNADEVFKELDE